MRFWSIILLCFFISQPFTSKGQQKYSVKGETHEISQYKVTGDLSFSILHMGYASSEIKDPELWNIQGKKIEEIDLVFTAYPKNKKDWITNYDWLLNKRIEALQKLEPSLLSNKNVKWNFILQNACNSEEEAERMFHGAVIKYSPVSIARKILPAYTEQGKVVPAEEINKTIETIVYGLSSLEDSIVFKTFDRNSWGKMLIVNDWTGSMHPYGAQAVLWHRLNFEKNAVKYLVFFNDGNQKITRQKRIGNTGGIYYCKPDSIEYLLKVMKFVAKRGDGGDIPENNIEALLKAIKLFKGYDELVMIADNNAGVRDMILLDKVKVPVRVLLCGLYKNQPIHPDYLEIARRTGGSIHTLEEDILGLQSLKEHEKISLNGIDYVVKKGKLVRQGQKSRLTVLKNL